MKTDPGEKSHELLRQHFDWQWNVHSWSKQANPSCALQHFLFAESVGSTPEVAIAWLLTGCTEVSRTEVHEFLNSAPAEDLFVLVAGAAGDRNPAPDSLREHLRWQVHASPFSLAEACRGPDLMAKSDGIRRFLSLCSGQSHNGEALQLYRAHFHADQGALWAMVEEVVTEASVSNFTHPFLEAPQRNAHLVSDRFPSGLGKDSE